MRVRAYSTARLIEMGHRMAMLPGSYSRQEWRSVATASGCLDAFEAPEAITDAAIIRTLILDKENPSSIRACLERARANGRAVRTALSREMWEALNDGWRKLELTSAAEAQRDAQRTRSDIVASAASEAETLKNRALREIERTRDQSLKGLFDAMTIRVIERTQERLSETLSDADQERLMDEALGEFTSSSTV